MTPFAGRLLSRPGPVRHGPRDRRRVALTFDDGPGPFTRDVLDVLEQENAVATFYVIGDQVRGQEQLLRRIVEAGHEIGNHSWNHVLRSRPLDAFLQLRATNGVLQTSVGVRPRVFRPPYRRLSRHILRAARLTGLTTVVWDVDSRDWELPGVEAICSEVISTVQPGSIVLMHDGGRHREQTVAALAEMLPSLRARGYELVTSSSLLGHEPVAGEVPLRFTMNNERYSRPHG